LVPGSWEAYEWTNWITIQECKHEPYLNKETAFIAVFISYANEFFFPSTILKELGGQTPWLPTVQMFDIVYKNMFLIKYGFDDISVNCVVYFCIFRYLTWYFLH
jgi:hypothetical protein